MEKQEIMDTMQSIFRKVFNNESIVITPETSADDVDEWTSLTYMQLITEQQEVFGVKYSLRDMLAFKRVGDMVDFIYKAKNS